MTRRERVHASIARKGLDALPWQFDLTTAVINKLKKYWGVEDVRGPLEDHILFAHLAKPADVLEPADPDLVRDELGATWRRAARDLTVGDWGELVDHPLKEPSLRGYTFPDASKPGRWDHVPELRRRNPDMFLVAGGFGLYESGWALCGFQNYLGYIAGEPAFVEELTEGLVEFSCGVTQRLAGLGCDAVRFGDDWGFQDHLMIRPEQWRAIFKKHYAKIYGTARSLGLIVSIHSCGNITDILPDLIDIGVQVVHPLQPEAMDVERCRRDYGKHLTFWGGLGSQSTLPMGTPDDVRREVRQRLALFRDGGYILAPAGAAPAETSAENIVAIVETAKAQLAGG
jgi:uroporphyrinogen decarboxylase